MIKKGTLIICPGCESTIAIVARDINKYDVLSTSMFIWEEGFRIPNGEKATCNKCGEYIFNANNQIHTKDGWRS